MSKYSLTTFVQPSLRERQFIRPEGHPCFMDRASVVLGESIHGIKTNTGHKAARRRQALVYVMRQSKKLRTGTIRNIVGFKHCSSVCEVFDAAAKRIEHDQDFASMVDALEVVA